MALAMTELSKSFAQIKDPRVVGRVQYPLAEILVITVCAVICGCDDWDAIADWAEERQDWLGQHLPLKNGTPCEDTFARVFAALQPKAFHACFVDWVASVFKSHTGLVVAVDGKTMRGSHARRLGKKAIHMVSAFSSSYGITLAQQKTDVKSNEITAIPALLDLLDLRGAIVTIDSMGCQKKIAAQIINAEADYVFGLKGNQTKLHEEVEEFFTIAETETYKNLTATEFVSVDGDHGRIETRRCIALPATYLTKHLEWAGLSSMFMVESRRETAGKDTTEYRYYVSSLPPDAKTIANAVRQHWHIENQLHWCLDVSFNEDNSRMRKDHAPENFALVRKMAMNLLNLAPAPKKYRTSMPKKRQHAMMNTSYLETVTGLISLEV